MLGTYVNVIAVVFGSLVGLFLKNGLHEKYKTTVMHAIGLSTLFIGMSTALANLFKEDAESLLFILSLVIGGLIGEWIGIDEKLEILGENLKKRFSKSEGDFALGFVTASLIFCVGTMSILGAFNSGLYGDHSMLYAKSVLDGVVSIILSSSLGIGVMFSSVMILIYQGSITIFAFFLEPFITTDMIREISIVGGIMIFSIGLNLLNLVKIKTANLLPAILVVIAYYGIVEGLIERVI